MAGLEDVISGVREELVRQLTMLRAGTREEPIVNFHGYVGTIAYTIWAEHLRSAYPARYILLNRLRYLLENRTNERLFALWNGEAGERWCGLQEWPRRDRDEPSPKSQWLLLEPTAAAGEALGAVDCKAASLLDLVARLLGWLGQPIPLRQLVDVLGELLEISDRKESLDHVWPSGAVARAEMADPAPSPVDALKWNEYLRWLWREMARLTLPQRSAFLLHSTVVHEFEFRGIASIRQIAGLLEIPAETLAEMWNEIPLGDLVIAARLARARQQVINLRRVARDRLGLAWKEWIK